MKQTLLYAKILLISLMAFSFSSCEDPDDTDTLLCIMFPPTTIVTYAWATPPSVLTDGNPATPDGAILSGQGYATAMGSYTFSYTMNGVSWQGSYRLNCSTSYPTKYDLKIFLAETGPSYFFYDPNQPFP